GAARACAAVAGGLAAVAALVYLPFVILDGPADAWRDVVGRSLRDGRYWRLPFPIDYDGPFRSLKDAKHLLQFYVPVVLLIGLAHPPVGARAPARDGAVARRGRRRLRGAAFRGARDRRDGSRRPAPRPTARPDLHDHAPLGPGAHQRSADLRPDRARQPGAAG